MERINRACRRCNENLLHLAVARSKSLPSVSYWKGSQQGFGGRREITDGPQRHPVDAAGNTGTRKTTQLSQQLFKETFKTLDMVVRAYQWLPFFKKINVSLCCHYHFVLVSNDKNVFL